MKELLIIKTSESEKIRSLLEQSKTDYEIVYKDVISLSEEEVWKRDILLANQDKQRQKEISEWDKISKVKDEQGW